jgi:hypothetical protein
MNNTEKKLDALIDALGFDVEEVVTTVHPPFSIMKAAFTDRYNQQGPVHTVNYKLAKRDELTVNLAATKAFKNMGCTVPTTIVSSTILKRELLKILETAGKKPKKETIAIIENAIDKAFKNE